MTVENNMDRDQAHLNVGPDLDPYCLIAGINFFREAGCIAWDYLNFEETKICQFHKPSREHCVYTHIK